MSSVPTPRLTAGLDPATVDLLTRHLRGMRARTGINHHMYLYQWREHLATLEPVPGLMEVEEYHVLRWIAQMGDEHLAPATIAARVAALRALYRRAEREGLIGEDPTAWVRLPSRARRCTRQGVDGAGLMQLLSAADAHASVALRALVYLWGMAGLRPTEPLECDVTDVEVREDVVTLRLPRRKGGDAHRVTLSPLTSEAVVAAVAGRTSGPLIVREYDGARMPLWRAHKELYALVREHTDLPHLVPYGLRASFITLSLEAGISERDLAAYVGHGTTGILPVYDQMRSVISTTRSASIRLEDALTA